MKQLLQLTHESHLISKKYSLPSSVMKSKSLRVSFGCGCQALFNAVRESTIALQNAFPSSILLTQGQPQAETMNDKEEEDSIASICSLPGEAFENLLTEKTPSVQQLKVIIHEKKGASIES
jgi:hypothetical protein